MYEYTVKKNADVKAFNDVCSLVLSKAANSKKEDYLEDVDGSQIMIINSPRGKIKVYNDYAVDAVYIDSETSLDNIL